MFLNGTAIAGALKAEKLLLRDLQPVLQEVASQQRLALRQGRSERCAAAIQGKHLPYRDTG